MAKTIVLPHLEPWQKDVYDVAADSRGTAKVFCIKAKRQVGKSILAVCLLIKFCLEKKCISVCVEPTLGQSRRVFKQVCEFLNGSGAIESANSQLLEIRFVNGSELIFKSAEQRESLRGFTVTGILVIDEASYIDDDIFQILYATTDANSAPILIISTPLMTSGEFYNVYMRGIEGSDRVMSFDWSKYDTSKFLSEEKLEYYRQTVAPHRFKSEYLGEFITQDGLLFVGIDKVLTEEAGDGPVVYIGIDFGTGSEGDYTVLTAIDNRGYEVCQHRTHSLTPTQQVDWLCGLIMDLKERKEIASVLCEYNSIGSVYIDMMKKKLTGIAITDFLTTNKSKQDLVTTLQIGIENEYIHLLSDPNLIKELTHYQADINPKTKTVTYNGYKCNDDCVMSLMFAYWAYKKSLGNFSISFA